MTTTPNLTLKLKRGDTLPPLVATLTDGGTIVDLTTATAVRVLLRRGSTVVINRNITGAGPDGVVTMPWQAGDTATAGVLTGEIEVTWPSSRVQTFPAEHTFRVEIEPDIGGSA